MSTVHKQIGFTVVELMVAVVLLVTAGVLIIQQKSQIEKLDRDRQSKTAINAMYYSLEEVYYAANHSYPSTISKDNLKSMDPALFTDPHSKLLGDKDSAYHYDPSNCEGSVCKSYTLRASLEGEAEYVKKSAH